MKCPLLIMNAPAANWGEGQEFANCLQEECAWWIKDCQRCCILDGVLCLNLIIDKLDDIDEKLTAGGKS